MAGSAAGGTRTFLAICYHDLPPAVKNDPYGVDVSGFVDQLEYMRMHGYSFVSAEEVRKARNGQGTLPEKAILLSFDDAYISFIENVVPVLELYQYPAMLAVCAGWIENGPPKDIVAPMMSWDQIKTLVHHPLVTVVSHSYDLHKAVPCNPQGNTAHAANTRIYYADKKRYETEQEFRDRLGGDHWKALEVFEKRTGFKPDIMVWPYGQYNQIALDEVQKEGFKMAFTLENPGPPSDSIMAIDRWIVMANPKIGDFVNELLLRSEDLVLSQGHKRAIQADLDLIYDPSPKQTEINLGRFLDRIVAINPDTVYLQAFADPDGDGNVDAVYFPNRVLPMRMDLLNRVATQLLIRGYSVYVWMPVLSVVLPDRRQNEELRVREWKDGEVRISSENYRRLSPFSPTVERIMADLYEDLAIHVRFTGVLFQDDAYLNDFEDFHPEAVEFFKKEFRMADFATERLTPAQKQEWTRLKTARLNEFTGRLMQHVRKYRPDTRSARTLYANTVLQPWHEEWLAQNYLETLKHHDYAVIMAYPEMEGVWRKDAWLDSLLKTAQAHPGALNRTVFKLQAYDWRKGRWISDTTLINRIRRLVAAGAQHVAYYPDDWTVNRPDQKKIRMEMSTTVFLFPTPVLPARKEGMR